MIIFPDIDPVIISFGPLAISWYSLSYVAGILLGWAYSNKLLALSPSYVSKKNIEDFVTWLIIGVIIGGRLGHVIFYDPAKYLTNPVEILKTYEGGMSFHGGILGAGLAAYLFCKKYNLKFLALGDLISNTAPIGLALGRVANFINAELYGKPSDVPWAVIFPMTDGLPRHPTQIYEALLEGVVLFLIMQYFAYKHHLLKNPGQMSGLFLIFYSFFRSFIEFFKEPDTYNGLIAGYFTMGQILCLPMIGLGLYLMLKSQPESRT